MEADRLAPRRPTQPSSVRRGRCGNAPPCDGSRVESNIQPAWRHNAHIPGVPELPGRRFDDRERLAAYIDGFRLLANFGIEAADRHAKIPKADGSPAWTDALVYTILFCYRHHLELRLKQLMRAGNLHLGRSAEWPTGHPIAELWTKCREVIVAIWPGVEERDLDRVTVLVSPRRHRARGRRHAVSDRSDRLPSIPHVGNLNLALLHAQAKSALRFLDNCAQTLEEEQGNGYR
jgi:hypothetical protein